MGVITINITIGWFDYFQRTLDLLTSRAQRARNVTVHLA